VGAGSAVVAVVLVMAAFYPLARLLDPTAGGDEPTGLAVELVLGTLGGVLLSPLAAVIGAVIGSRIGDRPISPQVAAALVATAVGLAVVPFLALNGGVVDESGSMASLLAATVLGALAGSLATLFFAGARAVAARHDRARLAAR
jgi:hypothetical protein